MWAMPSWMAPFRVEEEVWQGEEEEVSEEEGHDGTENVSLTRLTANRLFHTFRLFPYVNNHQMMFMEKWKDAIVLPHTPFWSNSLPQSFRATKKKERCKFMRRKKKNHTFMGKKTLNVLFFLRVESFFFINLGEKNHNFMRKNVKL